MWEINSLSQLSASLFAFVLGVIFSLVYDIIKASRKIGFNSFLLVFLGDIFFSLFCAIITFLFLLVFTNGALRSFVLIFELVGFVFWRYTLSIFFLKLLNVIFSFLKRLFCYISTALLRFSDKTERFLLKIYLIIKKTLKKSLKRLKKS